MRMAGKNRQGLDPSFAWSFSKLLSSLIVSSP